MDTGDERVNGRDAGNRIPRFRANRNPRNAEEGKNMDMKTEMVKATECIITAIAFHQRNVNFWTDEKNKLSGKLSRRQKADMKAAMENPYVPDSVKNDLKAKLDAAKNDTDDDSVFRFGIEALDQEQKSLRRAKGNLVSLITKAVNTKELGWNEADSIKANLVRIAIEAGEDSTLFEALDGSESAPVAEPAPAPEPVKNEDAKKAIKADASGGHSKKDKKNK